MGKSTAILIARRARERAADEASRAAEAGSLRRAPDALPAGYTLDGGEGGYYVLHRPDGETVPGPSRGKWQGRDGASEAAWRDVAGR